MVNNLIIEPEAVIEIEDAVNYYNSKKLNLGNQFIDYLDGYFTTLINAKAKFEIKRLPAYRELPLKRFPFIIIYEIIGNDIIIFSVFNTNRNPDKKNK